MSSLQEYPGSELVIMNMGDSLSPEIKALTRSSVPLRESDITPRQAAEIIYRSYYILSGRYHGKIFAKSFEVSYDEAICTFKCIAEEASCLDPKRAIDSIQYIKDFLASDRSVEGVPAEWSNDQRNYAIVRVNQLYSDMDIPFAQGMDNETLYRILARPHHKT